MKAELADDPAERTRGLMFRRELGRNAGMLFLFEAPSTGGFWMKNTKIPLSIAYMRSTGTDSYEVLQILNMKPCRADPCPSYPPIQAYDAALEVNRGWYDDHRVRPGDTAVVRR